MAIDLLATCSQLYKSDFRDPRSVDRNDRGASR